MDVQVKVMWWTLQNIAHSMMVHVQVLDNYIHFSLMYTAHHIFLLLPTIYLVNKDCEPTMPHKLETSTKHSLSNINVILCPGVVWKVTAHVERKALTMCHQSQKSSGISSLEPHNTKKGTSSTCLVHRKSFFTWSWSRWRFFYCVRIQVTSIFRGIWKETSDIIHSIWYIFPWTN